MFGSNQPFLLNWKGNSNKTPYQMALSFIFSLRYIIYPIQLELYNFYFYFLVIENIYIYHRYMFYYFCFQKTILEQFYTLIFLKIQIFILHCYFTKSFYRNHFVKHCWTALTLFFPSCLYLPFTKYNPNFQNSSTIRLNYKCFPIIAFFFD